MDDNFSPRVKDVITYSKEEALRLGHDFIGTEHLMLVSFEMVMVKQFKY
jgi:ATP-dependent Clp protease ATP-binding subunit ClpC